MSAPERFDVVIPTKNSEDTIGLCLDALFKSDIPIGKVYVINKGKDNTPRIAEDKGCVVIDGNANYSQALRLGASLSETPVFLVLDSDIIINPRFYSRLKHLIPRYFLVKGTFVDAIKWRKLRQMSLKKRLSTRARALDAAFINKNTFLRITKDWDSGQIDAGGDLLMYKRCEKLGIPVFQDPTILNIHLIGSFRRIIKQTRWYAKSSRTNRLYPSLYYLREFLSLPLETLTLTLENRDLRFIPFKIWQAWSFICGLMR